MKKIIILICILTLICGCKDTTSYENKPSKEETVEKVIKENNYIIVDVRTKEEYDESHIKDAINIPYDEIDEKVDLDKSKTILVYCKSGTRSKIAYDTLKEIGFEVIDLGAFEKIDLEKE